MALPPTKYVFLVPLIMLVQITFFVKESVGHTLHFISALISKQYFCLFITQSGIEGFLY